MSWIDKLPLAIFLKWLRGVLSEPDGTPSSTRVLMYAFSVFSMWLLWRCFFHIFRLTDPTLVTIWLSNMPMLVTTLIGLIALPYGINKGSATFSDIANMVTAAKTNNVNTAITGTLGDLKGMFVKQAVMPGQETPPAPAAVAAAPAKPAPATGSAGIKG
jgi:hypothetical protein